MHVRRCNFKRSHLEIERNRSAEGIEEKKTSEGMCTSEIIEIVEDTLTWRTEEVNKARDEKLEQLMILNE